MQALHNDAYLKSRFNGVRPPLGYFAARFAKRISKLCSAKQYDVIFAQKEVFPYIPDFVEAIFGLEKRNLVIDLDDAVFLFYEAAPSWFKRRFLSGKFPRLFKRSSLVLAGNRYLAAYAERYASNVVHFPTVVDTERFSPDEGSSGKAVSSTPVIGWIGSPETSSFLDGIVPALEELARSERFRFLVVGAESIGIRGVSVSAKPWSEENEVDDLRGFDIGVMPLPPSEWSKGKCALKLLQYMSTGIPAVSSPYGSAAEITVDGDNGFLAKSREEWIEKLGVLLRDIELRKRMGLRGREWVKGHYSLERYAPLLALHLKQLESGHSERRTG